MAWPGAWEALETLGEAALTAEIGSIEAASAAALGTTALVTRGGHPFVTPDQPTKRGQKRGGTAIGRSRPPPPQRVRRSINTSEAFAKSLRTTNIHRSINTSQAANMATQSKKDHQDEVQVMPHHGPMSKIIEDYHTINLTYFDRITKFVTSPGAGEFQDWIFRLNSIYDVDEAAGGTQQPLGRDTWASIYQYYRVLSCQMEVKIINRNNTESMIAGIVLEEDNSTLTGNRNDFMMRKNAIRRIIPGNNFANASLGEITYDYNPSSWDHHVQETGVEERWTPITETPSNNHKAILRMMMADGGGAPGFVTDFDVEFFVTMRYTVQFREANKTILTTGSLS
jgi:hypothetical protein